MSAAQTLPAPPLTARARELAESTRKLAQATRFKSTLPPAERPTDAQLALAIHELTLMTEDLAARVEELEARLPR